MSETDARRNKEKKIEKVAINFNLSDIQEAQLWEYLNRVSNNHSAYFKRLLYMEMRTNPNGNGFYPVGVSIQQPPQPEPEPEPEEEKPDFSADDLGGIVG